MIPLKERKITNKTKTGDKASSMTDGLGASVRFGSRGLLSAWDGVGLPAIVIKYGRGENETNVMDIADMAVRFVAKINLQLEVKAVNNLDISHDAIGCGDKSILHGEIRCLDPNFKLALAENGITTSKSLEKWGNLADSATENTFACINDLVMKNCSEEVACVSLILGEGLESVTEESVQNTETLPLIPCKSVESGQAFSELGVNSSGIRQSAENFRFTSPERKNKASVKSVLKTNSSIPKGFGEKIKDLLQSLTNQFKIATKCRTLKHRPTNVFVQNPSCDAAIGVVENRTGEMLNVNSSKNKLVESKIKSLLIADKTMLHTLSSKVIKHTAKVSATILQTLNLKNDSMLSPDKYMKISRLIYSEE